MSATIANSLSTAPVSVIIPCYNCTDTLERAISSIAAQTLRPAETLLVDDASTDGTPQTIHAVREKYGVDWIHAITLKENAGPATARNAAWNVASQPYIAFLDADDAWCVNKIEVQWAFMSAHPDVALSAHAYRLYQLGERINTGLDAGSFRMLTSRLILLSNRVATRTVMLRRDLPYRFKEGKRYAEDYLLWLQIACDDGKVALLSGELAYVYKAAFGEAGLSARLWKMEQGELSTLWQLVKEGRLPRDTALLFSIYSFLKYLRRSAITYLRRLQLASKQRAA